MGYAERSYSYGQSGGAGGPAGGMSFGGGGYALTPWVKRLLIANAAVFLLTLVNLLPFGWAVRVFGFRPDAGFLLLHPWAPVTYMFLHGGFWHIFVNMLVLFFFGPPLERAWGSRAFIHFYLVSGLGGALFSFLLLPVVGAAPVIGASAAIYGVMLAFALMWPEAPIYVWGLLPIKAKWFVGILAALAFYATFFGGGGRVADWAHLGGLVTGFLYYRYGGRVSGALAGLRDRLERDAAAGGAGGEDGGGAAAGRERKGRDGGGGEEGRGDPGDVLDEVDRILDKIRERGLDSLTEEEREFLDEMSRRYRG